MTDAGKINIPLQLSNDCVIASIQIELTKAVILKFRKDLLKFLETSRASAVILELSGVEIIDLDEFNALRRTMQMAEIMGAKVFIAGLKPGVISSLVDLNANLDNINAALDLDNALQMINELRDDEKMNEGTFEEKGDE